MIREACLIDEKIEIAWMVSIAHTAKCKYNTTGFSLSFLVVVSSPDPLNSAIGVGWEGEGLRQQERVWQIECTFHRLKDLQEFTRNMLMEGVKLCKHDYSV